MVLRTNQLCRRKFTATMWLCVWLAVLSRGTAGRAGDTLFAKAAAPLLRTYCADCHGDESAEAGLNLAALVQQPDFGARFRTWEKVLDKLAQRKMPPEGLPQPGNADRLAMAEAIQNGLHAYITEHAGDPGPVVMRRLTGAEYAWTIRDLSGLDLPLEQMLADDGVGGEGFANVGQVQFMQDSTLERYLDAARMVAAHAVIGSGPLDFAADPGQTGLELSAIRRIQEIYRRHGFRTGAGEGAEPFGLELYPRAFYVAWQYRHRGALGRGSATLAELAAAERISARFAEYVWGVLNEAGAAFPLSAIADGWRELPDPKRPGGALEDRVRAGCAELGESIREWQQVLAAPTEDEEEAAVLTGDALRVRAAHEFEADIDWSAGATTAEIEFSVTPASSDAGASIVVFRNPRVRFRSERRRRSDERPLKSVVSPRSREVLGFGRDVAGAKVGENDFALSTPATVSVTLEVPAGTRRAELHVAVELDLDHGAAAPVRCVISDGRNEGETVAESGGHSALLADPKSASYAVWKQGVLEFARRLPEVSHREPAPSDRDPIPPPFDNTYNGTERNLFHYRIKYHRDDTFLVEHILDDATRTRLDEAWTDLLSSFQYHDEWLLFVGEKYGLDVPEGGIAAVDRQWIAAVPDELREFATWLRESYASTQHALRNAEPGHVDDALRFAERAWRRPLTGEEQSRLRSFYAELRRAEDADGGGLGHADAVRAVLSRILVSPAFLYRVEPPGNVAGEAVAENGATPLVPLADWELASRLSYLLWSSVPDAELRAAAEAGRLREPEELARQARRMLRHPKARRFATEFFGQWFGFYRFDDYQGIDATRHPEFTGSLKAAMYDEAISFFEHIVREDRPFDEILFADYTFLNRELARHYGIEADGDHAPASRGDQPARTTRRAVSLANGTPAEPLALVAGVHRQRRGGLLRLGAVLTVTSAPLRTSPVKRGDWILRRVLGTPVPPPPPDAGSIPADDVLADGRTVRDRLEAHRRDASCVNCHSRMDPLGFALEHYDAVGRWREAYRDGTPIDAAGTLHDGTNISGPDGLHAYLRDQQPQFRRTLCSKLLGYALGRSEIASDRPLVRQMLARLDDGGGMSQLVVQVVTSRQFRYRRGSETSSATRPEQETGQQQAQPGNGGEDGQHDRER